MPTSRGRPSSWYCHLIVKAGIMNQQYVHSNTYEKETHSDRIVYDVSSAGSQYSISWQLLGWTWTFELSKHDWPSARWMMRAKKRASVWPWKFPKDSPLELKFAAGHVGIPRSNQRPWPWVQLDTVVVHVLLGEGETTRRLPGDTTLSFEYGPRGVEPVVVYLAAMWPW